MRKFALAFATCALCALFLSCAESTSQPTEATINPSVSPLTQPPDKVIERFFESIAESKTEDAVECTLGDALCRRYVQSQIELNDAFKLFGNNAVQHFGEEGKKLQLPSPARLAAQKGAQTPVTVTGSTALWPANPASPMKLVLVGGQWKLDLASSFPSADAVELSNKTFDVISGYMTEIAQDVAGGKFMTIDEVRAELKRRRDMGR